MFPYVAELNKPTPQKVLLMGGDVISIAMALGAMTKDEELNEQVENYLNSIDQSHYFEEIIKAMTFLSDNKDSKRLRFLKSYITLVFSYKN